MSFWINDRAGVAYESNEAGLCKWDPSSSSFNIPMSAEEIDALPFPCRRVTCEDAVDFARSHSAA